MSRALPDLVARLKINSEELAALGPKAALAGRQIEAGLMPAERSLQRLPQHTQTASSGFLGLNRSAVGMGTIMGAAAPALAGVAAGLGLGSIMAIKQASSLEQTRIAFTTMLGSGQAADKMIRDLQAFAAKTPFEFVGLEQSSQHLLAMGFRAEQVIPTMTAIGDAVAGLGGGQEKIDQVTNAIGQMQAKGRVQSDEMLQLTEAGIPAWDMLAKKIGVDIPTAMDMVQKGGVKAEVGVAAITEGMEKRFGGMMAKQSETVAGVWSNIVDTVQRAAGVVGAWLIKTFDIKGKLAGAQKFLDEVIGVLEGKVTKGGIADTMNAAKAAAEGLGKSMQTLADWAGKVFGFFRDNKDVLVATLSGIAAIVLAVVVPAFLAWAIATLAATWPLLAIGLAVGGLVFVVAKILDHFGLLHPLMNLVSAAFKGLLGFLSDNLPKVAAGIGAFFSELGDGATKIWARLSWLKDRIGEFFSQLGDGAHQIATRIGDLFNWIGTTISTSLIQDRDFIVFIWNSVTGFLGGVWNWITTTIGAVFNWIGTTIRTSLNQDWAFIVFIWNSVTGFLAGVWSWISSTIATVFRWISSTVSTILTNDKNFLLWIWNTITGFLTSAWDNIKGIAGRAWNAVHDTVTSWANKLKEGVQKTWDGLVSAAGDAGNRVWGAIRGGLKTAIDKVNDFLKLVHDKLGGFGFPNLHIETKGTVFAAKGGTIPGYAPGRDTVPAMLSPGEGILTPQTVRRLGGAAAISALNAGRELGGFASVVLGAIGGQCVEFIQRVLGLTFRGNANTWTGAPYRHTQTAAPGEVAVFTGGPYGHVAIVTGPGDGYNFPVVDSNWVAPERIGAHTMSKGMYGFSTFLDVGASVGGFFKNVLSGIPGITSPIDLLNGLVGNFLGGLGGGWVGDLIKGVIKSVAGGFFRADGGNVVPGRVYTVGERGPELFTSDTSGRIISNDQLGGAGSVLTRIEQAIQDGNELLRQINGESPLTRRDASRKYAT